MVEIDLSQDRLPVLCRLCLKSDEFLIDIFKATDLKSDTDSLASKILDLYQIKIEKNNDMPYNICHRCLYLTETFAAFRENVKHCEAKLRGYMEKLNKSSEQQTIKTKQVNGNNPYEGVNGSHGFVPDDNCEITVVDPNQEYESSDDCFSMEDSDSEYVSTKCVNGMLPRPEVKQNEITARSENIVQPLPSNGNEGLNEPKNTFLCQYCDMAFTTQMECDEHESRHDAANPFICNFCPFRTVNRQFLIYHIKESHDNERPYVCALCNKGFCRRSDLKKHTIVHTGVRPFSCLVCSKSFSRNTNLTKHMRIHSGVKPHVCQKCPRSFTTSADLIRHQRTHLEVKPHKCTKCPASFTRKDKMHKHYLSHLKKESELLSYNGDSQKIVENENMIIPLNPFVEVNNQPETNKYQTKDNHMGHNPKVIYPPKGPSSLSNSLLAAQLQKPQASITPRNEHPSVPKMNVKVHICNICSRSFTRKREFQRHQALHLDSLYRCKVCGKNFNRKDKLFRHEEIHHSEQYNCNQCNISFSKLEALQMHLKIHELQKSASKNEPYFGHMQEPTPMALGFYSEIKPEE